MYKQKIQQDFQDFADSIIWSNDDGSLRYIGVGNMADWWLKKIAELLQENIEFVAKMPPYKKVNNHDRLVYEEALSDIRSHLQSQLEEL